MYVCMYVCLWIYVCMYVCMYVCYVCLSMCVCMYVSNGQYKFDNIIYLNTLTISNLKNFTIEFPELNSAISLSMSLSSLVL